MAPGLCENCHTKPKFGTHRFCGKTCAGQAAKPVRSKQSQPQARAGPRNTGRQQGGPPQKQQLCTYCGQKPKFNNFDYCGKSCAALASAPQSKSSTAQGVSMTKQKRTRSAPPNTVQAPATASAKAPKAARPKPAVPPNYSTEEEEETAEEEDGGVSTDLDAYPSDPGSESEEEPSMPVLQPGAKSTASKGGKSRSGVPSIAPGTCAIPKCGQPSHVDRNGVKTKYCSTKHREEAVKLGLEAACILCQRYPQSSSDYFCSSMCRNQSMTKT